MKALKPIYLFPFVLIALVTGMVGGWIRIGYTEIAISGSAANHGILMVGGFLGTLISLERAMVMRHKVWLVVPLISGLSIPVLLLLGWPTFGMAMMLSASLGLMGIMYLQSLRHPALYQYVMSVGALSWMLGNFSLLYTGFVPGAVPWWIGFVLFTIVGERLELSKFLPTPVIAKKALVWLLAAFFIGLWLPFHDYGNWLMGAAIIFMSFWLLHFDIAKVAAQKSKQFKYIGIGLRVGYFWLTLHGIILTFMTAHSFHYDLYIHTFFLGFTFSMIWAHAPIILPMILNIKINLYHPILWIGWSIFQLSLLGRILSSVFGIYEWRTLFGVINGYSILAQFALMAGIVFYSKVTEKKLKVVSNRPIENNHHLKTTKHEMDSVI